MTKENEKIKKWLLIPFLVILIVIALTWVAKRYLLECGSLCGYLSGRA